MIKISRKIDCTGCGACVAACPLKIIHLNADEEGVNYPVVDEDKCVGCNKCERVCPILNKKMVLDERDSFSEPICFAAQLCDKADLNTVSSGGAFWGFAQKVICGGGIVYGATQVDVDTIEHRRADNLNDAKLFCGSKYLQSKLDGVYQQIRNDLENDKVVLFSGTGCQIAGVYRFLDKIYPNLLTCEVVCHGVPCGLAWTKYKKEKEELTSKKIESIYFRDKGNGWKNNRYRITYDDGSTEYERSTSQLFHFGYLLGLYYRPSCGKCEYVGIPRVADITLADYWDYKGDLHKYGDLGVSLVFVNTVKGEGLLQASKEYLDLRPSSYSEANNCCTHLNSSPSENKYRSVFMHVLKTNGFHKAIGLFDNKKPKIVRLLNKIKRELIFWRVKNELFNNK